MRAHPFEGQLERLARTLTEQFGVNVICQGDNAWTDGRQIVLPSLPEPLNEKLERMMVGYLDHEMAHVAFSEFKVAEEFAKKHPGFEGMLNVVEDALIERRAMERWLGVRTNLDVMFAQVRDRVATLIAHRGPFDRFCTAVYLKLAHYNDMMGLDGEVVGYGDLLQRFAVVRSTRESAELSEALLCRWLGKHPQQSKANSQGKGGEDKSATSGSSQGNQSHSSEPGQAPAAADSVANPQVDADSLGGGDPSEHADDQQSQPDAGNAEQPDRSREASSSKAANRERPRRRNTKPGNDQKPDDLSAAQVVSNNRGSLISQAVADAIAEAVAHLSNSREYRAFTKQHDRIAPVSPAGDSDVQTLLAAGADIVRRLRRGLANALRSAEKRWWRDDQVRGLLSPRTLYRLCTERTQLDVFRVRSVVQGRSTAVSVVLDASGSMTSRKMDVARQSMRVLLEALGDSKIPTEAFTFTTGDGFNLAEACKLTGQEYTQLQERFSRFGNLEIGLIKRFEEPVKPALRRLPAIRGTGLTPLGEAMQVGASRLSVRAESRKIMLVLTDGRAGCECGDTAAVIHAQHVAGLCRKAGIELVGVGIQDDSLRAIVVDTIVIHALSDLPAQLCKLLGRTLQKGLCHVG